MVKYSDGDDRVDVVLGAIANERRRAVLTRLCAGPATSTDLAHAVTIGLPAIHRHLDVLRAAGLIHSVKEGRVVRHTLDLEPLSAVDEWIETRRSFWTNQLDALAAALEEGTP